MRSLRGLPKQDGEALHPMDPKQTKEECGADTDRQGARCFSAGERKKLWPLLPMSGARTAACFSSWKLAEPAIHAREQSLGLLKPSKVCQKALAAPCSIRDKRGLGLQASRSALKQDGKVRSSPFEIKSSEGCRTACWLLREDGTPACPNKLD